jgi:hypothetical protein
MSNEFANVQDSPLQSARNASAVTPHDTTALSNVSKALYVGGYGNIVCRLVDDSADVTFTGVPAGSILPVRVTHVRSTNTTATNILNLY